MKLCKTDQLTNLLTDRPTERPTFSPTDRLSDQPNHRQTDRATNLLTDRPTELPTYSPTDRPSDQPTHRQTDRATNLLTDRPIERPTAITVTCYVTQQNRALCVKLTIHNLLNTITCILRKLMFHNFPVFATLNHNNRFSFCQFYYIKISHILILFSNLRVDLPSSLCPSGTPIQNSYIRFSSPVRATCPVVLASVKDSLQ